MGVTTVSHDAPDAAPPATGDAADLLDRLDDEQPVGPCFATGLPDRLTVCQSPPTSGLPRAGSYPSAVDAFAALLAMRGQIDFDDLVVGAVAALEADPQLRARWQTRFSHLCVDEFQDVDAAQLRLVQLLAAPEDNLFVVGDDDQP